VAGTAGGSRNRREGDPMNAVELLTRQHRELEQLLERARSAEGPQRVQVLGSAAELLAIHTKLEEKHLYPLARDQGMVEDAERSTREHRELRDIVENILEMKRSDPRLLQAIETLDRTMRQHVGIEEQKMLPALEQAMSARQLEDLGDLMTRTASDLQEQELLAEQPAEGTEEAPPPPAVP
jgi:hemerythrin-like domain-containing protein